MKIIFFGSDDFATAHLEELLSNGCEVVGVVTQPDRPKDRGMKMQISPLKAVAQENNIELLQPYNMKDEDFIKQLNSIECDLFIVIAYGKILPKEILDIPNKCALNVHGSLLPEYRGAAPINWAIINGDTKTGISIIRMNPKMDAGDIVAQAALNIDSEDDAVELRRKMIELGKKELIKTLSNLDNASKQDESKVTIAPKLTKQLGQIDWNKSAKDLNNLIRGLVPWPTAYTSYKDKGLKILKAEVVKLNDVTPGEIIEIQSEGFIIGTGQDALLVKEVHLEASKRMDVASFIRGHKLEVGMKLGEKE